MSWFNKNKDINEVNYNISLIENSVLNECDTFKVIGGADKILDGDDHFLFFKCLGDVPKGFGGNVYRYIPYDGYKDGQWFISMEEVRLLTIKNKNIKEIRQEELEYQKFKKFQERYKKENKI